MTVVTPPAFLQGGTYTALLDRMHLNTITTPRDFSQTNRGRGGFLPTRTPTYSNPAGMQVSISACAGVVPNTFAADAGEYRFANPSSTSVTLAASSPTQNRIDLVGFQIKDNFYDSSGLNQVAPAIIQGTNSAGAPSAPAVPSGFLPVVEALVNANAVVPTSLTSRITRTTLEGAELLIANATERTALGTPQQGFRIFRLDRNWSEVWDGSAWRVQGLAVVSSVADLAAVTNPYNGLEAFNTGTNSMLQYRSGAWHLELPISYDQPTQTGSGSLGATATATIATQVIPDLGVPIKVEVWGSLETTTPATGIPSNIQGTFDSTVWDTNRIGLSALGIGAVVGIDTLCVMQPRQSAQLAAGAHTIRLLCKAGANAITVGTTNYNFGVRAVPAVP